MGERYLTERNWAIAAGLDSFCRERGIQNMSLFGSVVRDDFDLERSDVDVLVENSKRFTRPHLACG